MPVKKIDIVGLPYKKHLVYVLGTNIAVGDDLSVAAHGRGVGEVGKKAAIVVLAGITNTDYLTRVGYN